MTPLRTLFAAALILLFGGLFSPATMTGSEQKELPPAAVIATVLPKLPDFWPHAAAVWISQIEAQFRVAGITRSQTKYDLAVQRLGEATAVRLQDLLISPPENPYEALVKRLTAGFAKSTFERLSDFNALPALGDRRPTELLNSILASLAGIVHDSCTCPHVQYAFLSRLPVQLRSNLTGLDFSDLRVVAEKADEAWSTIGAISAAASVLTVGEPSPSPPLDLVAAVRDAPRGPPRQQHPQQPQQPRQQQRQARQLCWYHNNFGNRARRCNEPCEWSGNGQAGGRRN